jgi:hypothetical protein
VTVHQKLDTILENKVLEKLNISKMTLKFSFSEKATKI